ncbi:MAG: S9 family peptidase, partial [Pirellulales bacterium]|nr:S9 family peptidase [Pirellulales bacterium]
MARIFNLMALPALLIAAVFCQFAFAAAVDNPQELAYPQTKRVDHVDVYHGTKVADPYRWLEDDARESKQVAAWVAAENEVTFKYLHSIPQLEPIRRRLTELWNYPKYSSPFKEGGRYFFFKNDGLRNQSVLYTMNTFDGEPRVLLDPNTWSDDGTVALAGLAVSDDGRYLAYGRADAGSDWCTWRVMEIDGNRLLEDKLRWIKYGGVSWKPDGSGFFYSRYDEPKKDAKFQELNLNNKLYFHRIGSRQSEDEMVYKRSDEPTWSFWPKVSEDGRYLVITVSKGTDDRYRVLVKNLDKPHAEPVELISNFDNEYSFIGNDGSRLFFKNDLDAPRGRVIAIDLGKPGRENWKEIIPQSDATLTSVTLVGDMFIAQYLKDVRAMVKLYTLDGRHVRDVKLPTIGAVSGFDGHRSDTETFYSFASFTSPPIAYRYDLITGKSTLWRRAEVKFNPDEYQTEQVFFNSKDGTRVPMFLVHKKGLELDGNNPTLLYGYGGFAISLRPRFKVENLMWMELGGVYAVANLRGGGEYGEAWHKAGKKINKQNVFDDFIAAAQWLVDNKYTSRRRLAIQGGSNGGLLVGAVMTQRPELFGACLPAVGVMDM